MSLLQLQEMAMNAATQTTLRSQLLDRLARGEVDLRLDGSEVTFIDSVGVSVLMAVYARCTAVGGQVRIEPASDRLRATLASVGVDDVLLPI
jgi:anti-sigma B factor antagonist